jgi:pimeloyl-ACP methyl ester carboxylesterase
LETPLVFVHGFACTHADWQQQLVQFSADHPVYAPDLRGHGATHARPEDCSIETYGADIAALLDGRDLNGAVLIGHSMGCRVVLQAYLNAPERIAAIALVDGSFRGSNPNPVVIENYPDFARKLFGEMFLSHSALGTALIERAMRFPASIGSALYPGIARWDAANMERALAAVKVPMLVIQTTTVNAEGKRVALKAGETMPWLDLVRRHTPQARIEIIPGIGHFPQLEVPEQVNELLSGFIGR